MRDVHFCKTCDFRLPYCVRTDRAFCGTRCRVWWYRHPGHKRLDFSPGDEIPARRKNGQPKTLAEALLLLEAERARAAELEDATRRAQTQEGVLRNELTALRDELSEERTKLTKLRDELADERKKQAETELLWRKAEERADEMEASYNSLADDLERAKEYTSELEEEIESERRKAEDVRYDLEQDIKQLRRESDELRETKERVDSEHESLTRRFDELIVRVDEGERALTLLDGELQKHQQDFAASERAHREIHSTAESVSRSLNVEKERRLAAERRVEQLTLALDRVARSRPSLLTELEQLSLLDLRDNYLTAELEETRQHRDLAVAEREFLTARILHLMSPGQYLEHAAAAGYDLVTDPLIKLKRSEVLVENQLANWQEVHGKQRRARRFDSEQTLDEQAYAAAMSMRWKHIDHPHLRRKIPPKWRAIGFLLDTESEQYLLTLTESRIAAMQTKMTS